MKILKFGVRRPCLRFHTSRPCRLEHWWLFALCFLSACGQNEAGRAGFYESEGRAFALQITESNQQKVTLKGYLHRSAQDEWYLTPRPDTPSCCVASANKSHEQIFLSNFTVEEVSNKPITVEGILKISPNHPKFTLLEATKIEDNKKHFPWIAISFAALSIGVFLIGKKVIDR